MQKKDDLYIKDLKKQADDIDLMIERMEEQIKSLSTSYKTEIEEIEVGSIPDRTLDQSRERERWRWRERGRIKYLYSKMKWKQLSGHIFVIFST